MRVASPVQACNAIVDKTGYRAPQARVVTPVAFLLCADHRFQVFTTPDLAPFPQHLLPTHVCCTVQARLPKHCPSIARGLQPTAKSGEENRSMPYSDKMRVALPVFSLYMHCLPRNSMASSLNTSFAAYGVPDPTRLHQSNHCSPDCSA